MTNINTNDFYKNKKIFQENCDIEKVFERRKCTNKELTLDNSVIMYNISKKLCIENKEIEENSKEIGYYICNHDSLSHQLVDIVEEAEDLQTCRYAIDILYKLLINSKEIDKMALKKTLSIAEKFMQLLQSIYSLHLRFYESSEYKEAFQDMYTKLMHTISIIYEVQQCRDYVTNINEKTIQFVGHLLALNCKNKEFFTQLLGLLRIICFKKKNCEILASRQFFDGLHFISKFTQKIITTTLILKLMSRNASALNCMSRNEKVFNLILTLANYNGKKPISKRSLMTTLYRISRTVYGSKLLFKEENFNKLFNYFIKNDNLENFSRRIAKIKAYTILNRFVPKETLPSSHIDMHLDINQISDDDESSSDESEDENDNLQEIEELWYEKECDSIHNGDVTNNNLNTYPSSLNKTDVDVLERMNIFYMEFNQENRAANKFKIYEGIGSSTNASIKQSIEKRVIMYKFANKLAHPDALMLEAENDEHYVKSSINNFCVEHLAEKLARARYSSDEDQTNGKIVYNLDKLYNYEDTSQLLQPFYLQSDLENVDENSLKFESRFECGNLRTAKQIGDFEYDLLLTPDTHCSGGHQWFYFQISNIIPDQVYIFNIINFIKINSQYNYGMQPLMFSVMDYTLKGVGWKRVGEKIVYYGNNYTDENGTKQYRTLSFCITFNYANDYIYFAYHYPYTYTRLMTLLFPLTSYTSEEIYLRLDKLCDTVNSNNEVALLTITASTNSSSSLNIALNKRPIIFITARVHPGETNSSWIMEGIIKFLLDTQNEQARKVREHFIFKIIPMLNPEGVIYGNTRSGFTGSDLNRCWSKPNENTCPEIYYPKKLVEYAKKKLIQPIAFYIDIHGHSRKKFFFFYGCNPKLSWNKKDRIRHECPETLKILPQMVQILNENCRPNFCKYKIQKKRESTARVVMWREFGIRHSYTLECSYCSGANQQGINTKILTDIGRSIIATLGIIAEKIYTTK